MFACNRQLRYVVDIDVLLTILKYVTKIYKCKINIQACSRELRYIVDIDVF